MQYSLINDGRAQVLTVLVSGMPYVATSDTHPNFNDLVTRVLANDESVVDDFTVEKAVADRFERLSDRVTVAGGKVFFDGDEVDDALTEQILRFRDAGVDDWKPLVLFFDKVAQNPNDHSREQLFRWLARHKFTLTADGDIVGYKGVQDDLTSVHRGPAIVDDVAMNGHIPNNPGSTIEMARSKVAFDPAVGCASGLHVANWDYASGWGSKTLEVHVNPRDVVSVPTDSGDSKVRVCRYVVVKEVTEPYAGPVLESSEEPEPFYDSEENDALEDDFGWSASSEDWDEDPCYNCGDTDCDDFDYCEKDEPVVWSSEVLFVSGPPSSGKSNGWDTRLNHTTQKRDANGRFIPKS